MKALIHICLILFGLAVLSSCAKDELESPNHTPNPSALIQSEADNAVVDIASEGSFPISAAEVNDDGDDETAGPNPDPKK